MISVVNLAVVRAVTKDEALVLLMEADLLLGVDLGAMTEDWSLTEKVQIKNKTRIRITMRIVVQCLPLLDKSLEITKNVSWLVK